MPLKLSRADRFALEGNFCSFGITEAIGGILAGATVGAADIGGAAALGGALADTAAITLPDVAVSALAPAAFTAADVAAPLAVAGGAAGLAAGAIPAFGEAASAPFAQAPAPATPAAPFAEAAAPNIMAPLSVGATATGGAPITASPLSSVGPATGSAPALGGSGIGSAASIAAPGGVAGGAPIGAGDVTGALASPGSLASSTSLASTSPGLGTDISGGEALGAGPYADTVGGAAAAGPGAPIAPAASSGLSGAFKEALPYIGPAASVGGLALAGINSLKPLPYQPEISGAAGNIAGEAAQLEQQGSQLGSYLTTGTLPPGAAEGLQTATASADASIKSKYAQLGESGSSAEAEDLQNVQMQAAAQRTNIGISLLQQGINEQTEGINATGLDANLYSELMNTSLQQDTNLGSAIGNFASSLVPRTTINVNGTPAAA